MLAMLVQEDFTVDVRAFSLSCLSALALSVAAAATAATAHGILLGVGTHFINYPTAQPKLLGLAQQIGAESVRADTGWRTVEAIKGTYKIPVAWDEFVDNATRRGIQPLLILDYGNKFYDDGKLPRSRDAIEGFVHFASYVVTHFSGRVHYYEIWNEWNTGTGGYYPGGTAQEYARLFDPTYAAIKRIDPTAIVLATAGYYDWYAQLARVGVAGRADGVAIHPYVARDAASPQAVDSNGAERSVQLVINAEQTMRRVSGKNIPIYVTEIGWPTSTGNRGFPESAVAQMAERSLLMFSALPYVRGVWWYDLIDDGTDSANAEDRFGLFSRRQTLKPAGQDFQSLALLLKSGTLTWNSSSDIDNGLVVLEHHTAQQTSIIAWHVNEPERQSNSAYAASCNPSLSIVRVAGHASTSYEPIPSIPTVITYDAGHCASKPLLPIK